ncbi:MAG: hypothetical protein Q8Q28_13750 [Pseudomonadota bacterium]|nr:hypothetical protein [Pseudomonadota bacterium]
MKYSKVRKKPAVIPAQAGIQVVHLIDFQSNQPYELDFRLRGNDGYLVAGNSSQPLSRNSGCAMVPTFA